MAERPPWALGPSGGEHCSPEERLAALRRAPFFADLHEDALAEVNGLARARGYVPGETVISAGSPADALLIVASGALRWSRPTAEGKDVVLDLLGPGDVCGSLPLLGDARHVDDVVGQTAGCVLVFDAAAFGAVLDRYPSVTRRALEAVASRLEEAHEAIRRLSVATVGDRVAAVLARLDLHLGRGARAVRLPVTQEELAGMVGSTLETVNRSLARLRRRGAIETGRGWVRVLERDALTSEDDPD